MGQKQAKQKDLPQIFPIKERKTFCILASSKYNKIAKPYPKKRVKEQYTFIKKPWKLYGEDQNMTYGNTQKIQINQPQPFSQSTYYMLKHLKKIYKGQSSALFPVQILSQKKKQPYGFTFESSEKQAIYTMIQYLRQLNEVKYLKLNLTRNQFLNGGDILEKLITQRHQISKLQQIALYCDNSGTINDVHLDDFLDNLSHSSPKLKSLTLSYSGGHSSITNEGFEYLKVYFSRLEHSLQNVSLNFATGKNRFDNQGIRYIGQAVGKLQNLRAFKLNLNYSGQKITDSAFQGLVKNLNFQTLETLDLIFSSTSNQITDESLEFLGQQIQNSPNVLRQFSLNLKGGSNSITGKGIKLFSSDFLKNSQNLIILELVFSFGNHDIGEDDLKVLGKALQKCKKLELLVVDISSNDINISDPTIYFQNVSARQKFITA